MTEREIIDTLKAEKERRCLTLRQLSTGRAYSTYSAWFRGKGSTQVLTLICLAEALDMEVIVRPKQKTEKEAIA